MPQVNLEHWRGHVLAALQADVSFAAYAREHGLSRHTLYSAHRLLKDKGELSAPAKGKPARTPKAKPATAFIAVKVAPLTAPYSLCARLPNGIELRFTSVDPSLLQQLAALSCLV